MGEEGGDEGLLKKCPEISDGLNRLICIRYGHRKHEFMDMRTYRFEAEQDNC